MYCSIPAASNKSDTVITNGSPGRRVLRGTVRMRLVPVNVYMFVCMYKYIDKYTQATRTKVVFLCCLCFSFYWFLFSYPSHMLKQNSFQHQRVKSYVRRMKVCKFEPVKITCVLLDCQNESDLVSRQEIAYMYSRPKDPKNACTWVTWPITRAIWRNIWVGWQLTWVTWPNIWVMWPNIWVTWWNIWATMTEYTGHVTKHMGQWHEQIHLKIGAVRNLRYDSISPSMLLESPRKRSSRVLLYIMHVNIHTINAWPVRKHVSAMCKYVYVYLYACLRDWCAQSLLNPQQLSF